MTMQKTAPQAQNLCCFIGITSIWRETAVFCWQGWGMFAWMM